MKLENIFTISKSNTGWHHKRHFNPLLVVMGVFLCFLVLYIVHEVVTSKFLSQRERITVGVYDNIPYVFSYDKTTNLGTIIYFNPDVMVTVPGGYGWYRLGSVRLLATIEHKTNILLTQTFAQLVGAPIDAAIYLTAQDVIYEGTANFLNYFMSKRGIKTLFSKDYATSTTNLIDRLLINRALNTSPDRLIVVDAENDYITRDHTRYYTVEKLDSHSKGYLYQKTPAQSSVKVRVLANSKEYKAGTEIARLIEGMGIKVLSVDEVELPPSRECTLRYGNESKRVAALLYNYFPCRLEYAKEQGIMIDFQINTDLATLYL